MGAFWAKCCDCSDGEDQVYDAGVAQTNESLLLTRTASMSGEWTGDRSPEEGGSRSARSGGTGDVSKGAEGLYVNRPKIVPASAEEEREYMVRSYSSGALFDVQPECLLCLESFTEARPTALSLCACGVNRNTFHLECLLEWRRRSNKTNCPVCDNELFFDATTTASSVSADVYQQLQMQALSSSSATSASAALIATLHTNET
jgi:hypothetical protein